MREELTTLKHGTTQSGTIPPSTDSQHSNFDFGAGSSSTSPPTKRSRPDNNGKDDEDELFEEEDLELTGNVITLSEAASTFLEASFSAKLKNDTRKTKATKNGIPDSRWTKCPMMDAVVAASISSGAKKADRSASRLQQFWLDATIPLVLTLEREEELNFPPKAIVAIQARGVPIIGSADISATDMAFSTNIGIGTKQ